MTRQPSPPSPAPSWRVHLRAHDVPPRWRVDELAITVPAVDRPHARLLGVREGHRRASVPPLDPLRRVSLPFASAEPVDVLSKKKKKKKKKKKHDPPRA